MKTFFNLALAVVILLSLLNLHGAPLANDISPTPTANVPPPTPYSVVGRDASSRVWERTVYELDPSGKPVPKKHHYNELATGLHYLVNGQWVESKEEIEILPNGTAQAIQGQHKAYFPGDIYNGEIEVVTPDGRHLKSRPLGLSYFDGKNSVLIAELKSSTGVVVGNNQVIYPDAFTDFKADLRYTYTKAGFAQEVVFQEQPAASGQFGLNSENSRLQLLTEFFDTPEPSTTQMTVSPKDGLRDTTLTFGKMKIMRGKAFSIDDSTQIASRSRGTPVYKSWQHLEGRAFLVEELPVLKLETQLEQLPKPANASVNVSSVNSVLHKVSATRLLPLFRLAQAGTNKMQLAKADLNYKSGVVLDYDEIIANQTDFTFQGDATYFITGLMECDGNTTIEGGTVIKYAHTNTATVYIPDSLACKTASYRPAVLTAADDDTVGEIISGSTGNPSGHYGWIGLQLEPQAYVKNIHVLNLNIAFGDVDGNPETFSDVQIINCRRAFDGSDLSSIIIENSLLCGISNVMENADGWQFRANQVTIDRCNTLANTFTNNDEYEWSSVFLTNCLFINLTNLANSRYTLFYTNAVVWLTNDSGVFQTIGGGVHYLANNSPYRNTGTTNISPTLLADIRTKTTYPPIVYSNITISVETTFSPQAQRDTDAPDIGYHYDPIDYFFGGVNANSNLTFTAGTAVGWFPLPGTVGIGYGISPANDVTVVFNGTATSPCTFVRNNIVQEGGNGLWTENPLNAGISGGTWDNYDENHPSALEARFTLFTHLAGENNHFRDGPSGEPLIVRLTHCELLGAFSGAYNMLGSFTNCLLDRVTFWHGTASSYPYEIFKDCTFHGGSFSTDHWEDPPYWTTTISNCAYDGTGISMLTNGLTCDYNAFLTNTDRLPIQGAHDVIVTNYSWQSSWFGNYYLPTTSLLINAGSMTAGLAGLYHFTTQTAQWKEANSVVDIGYHYVATDGYGNPLDSDGDGIPDYLEDANGNGAVNIGETDWQNPIDLGLKVWITKPGNGSIFP